MSLPPHHKSGLSQSGVQLLERLLLLFESRAEYLAMFSKLRMKGEEWAKVEILKMLDDLAGNREIMEYGTERSYGDDTGNRCDIVIKDIEGTEYWIEMKAFPTNYCTNVFPHKGRPITDFIDDCREGIRRVVQVKVHDRIPCFLFLAYPFPSQTEQREWVGHLTKLRGLGLTALRTLRIQLNNESEARVYLLT